LAGGGFEDVVVKAYSRKTKISVMDVPEAGKPLNFSGGVGNLNYKVEATKNNVKSERRL
jgi:hypothetical protein